MKNLVHALNGLVVVKNAKGDRVEQKQARKVKADLMDGFAKVLTDLNVEVMYDEKDSPVIVLDNGLVIGFDFVVRKLDTPVFAEKEKAQ